VIAPRPFVIGITGNIGVGKSTAARMLGSLGAHVIDADQVARQTMRAGTPVFGRLAAAFGHGIVRSDGEIDRGKLAAIVFDDPAELERLESIVHPETIRVVRRQIAGSPSALVVVEAIKLIEAGMAADCDSVWVVTSRRGQQIERAFARGMPRDEAERRLASQSSQSRKIERADVVIDNSGSLCDTWAQVKAAWSGLPVRPPEEAA
jgi:dephospho-CoA kinase